MNAHIAMLAAVLLLAGPIAAETTTAEPDETLTPDLPQSGGPCHLVEVYTSPPFVKVNPSCPP